LLLLVVEDHQDIIVSESLDALTKDEMVRIIKWATVVHYEASDNPCRARCAPKCLRKLLPKDHYLQTWRMPKRQRRRHARAH
jgi:hypothetical protein